MRGVDLAQGTPWRMTSLEKIVPGDHLRRPVRESLNRVLECMNPLYEARSSLAECSDIRFRPRDAVSRKARRAPRVGLA